MNDDDLDRLDEILDLPDDDPRRVEALRDGRLRNLLREYESFLRADAADEAPAGEGRPVRRSRRPRRRFIGFGSAIAAGLALVAVLSTPWLFPEDADDVSRLRSGESPPATATGLDLVRNVDTLLIDWPADVRADSAQVLIYGADLREIDRRTTAATPPLRLDLSPFRADGPLGVRIVLFEDDDVVLRTPLRPVPED